MWNVKATNQKLPRINREVELFKVIENMLHFNMKEIGLQNQAPRKILKTMNKISEE
jgi:hypothetical protein